MAGVYMMAALFLGAGLGGLPFSQDIENGADRLWRFFTGRDPGLQYKLQDAMQDHGFGRIGAEIAMRGPLSELLGVDLGSRIGFGDVLTREFESANVLGTVPSIIGTSFYGAWQRAGTGQLPAAVAAEMAPGALRGPLRAYAATEQGIVSRSGMPGVPAQSLSSADIARLASGFTPLTVTRHNEEVGRYAVTQHSTQAWTDMVRAGRGADAAREMQAAGWSAGRIKQFERQAMQPPGPGRQFQRFEQQRAQ
jgi:hypothetical protein